MGNRPIPAAEDHPVKISDRKRVWIELISSPLMADDE